MNQVTLMGRLTRDPELRQTAQGTPVASWTLAVDKEYQKGEERQAEFYDCVGWNKTGEFVARNFRKGQQMAMLGRLSVRDWTDKEGNKRRSYEIVARDVFFCGPKPTQFDVVDDEGDLPF